MWSSWSKGTKYEVAPIIIGAMGHVPKSLINYLKMIGFDKKIKNIDQKTTNKIDFRNS